jgi:hypothetical protein
VVGQRRADELEREDSSLAVSATQRVIELALSDLVEHVDGRREVALKDGEVSVEVVVAANNVGKVGA